MGHPRRHRRKYSRPLKPYDKNRITNEKSMMKKYGLRRKKEIWKAEAVVRIFRQRARDLLVESNPKLKEEMMQRLRKMGITVNNPEDVLSLKLEDLLSRRLETIVHKKGVAKSLKEARQMIVHGHVKVGGKVVEWPGYIVPAGLEGSVESSRAYEIKKEAS
ncbi:MAG: 30S ribosomal protein S4 [Candidatus Aenigmarchaeota archaeon]|nr:30S ribosomal protein S4 [Candidatus Aenigmarchaeota archaeon]